VADGDHEVVAEMRGAEVDDAFVHPSERLATGRREHGIAAPPLPLLGPDLAQPSLVPLAVVDLDEPFVVMTAARARAINGRVARR
jgi:hypothetical protein